MQLSKKHTTVATLTLIIILAFFLRTMGINWDQGQHLHPDERFLTMVTQKLTIPHSLSEYLDPAHSSMNPYNKDTPFFVYGLLPITIVKLVVSSLHMDTYDGIALWGRFLSALFDMGTLVFIYKLACLLRKRLKMDAYFTFLAPVIYAILVLSIQLSHFFTVDTFMTFFTTGTLYFALRFFLENKGRHCILSALFFGCALATKVSALYLAPLVLFLLTIPHLGRKEINKSFLLRRVGLLLVFGGIVYLLIRIADPHLFRFAIIFNPRLATQYLVNMKELAYFASPKAGYFPPAVQWYQRPPVLFAAINMAVFGVGVPIMFFIISGLCLLLKKGNLEWRAIGIWSLLFFLFQSTRFSPSMRYFFILYPLLAIYGASGISAFMSRFKMSRKKTFLTITIALLLFIWPAGFVHIYLVPHSRVQASYWINQNIAANAVIATEHWDDGLPLRLPDVINNPYIVEQLPVFGEDTSEKWQQINVLLAKTDYIIFSSNRGYGSIERLSKMYPKMAQWYRDLFEGKLSYVKIRDFSSYPSWCLPYLKYCFSFDDQWSEEAFTVYDHPKVLIFKKIVK